MSIGNSKQQTHLVKIGGMQCSFCVQSIEKALKRMDGVETASVNLSHEEALIEFNPDKLDSQKIDDTLVDLGYTVRDPKKVRSFEEEEREIAKSKKELVNAGIVTGTALVMMIFGWMGYAQPWFRFVLLALSLIMIFGVARNILGMAISSFRRGIYNQHVLMEFGAFGGLAGGIVGFFISDWPMMDFFGAAIFITAYHILSGHVSLIVRTNSSRSIMKLMKLQPSTARVITDGKEMVLPIEEVQVGDRVRVRPGESIPVDGVVVEGESSVNQSLVTGESIPKFRKVGDEVIGGSINLNGSLVVEVTRVGEESFLQQVARSIQEARALKPGVLQTVEKVLKYFVPGVISIAATSLLFWTLGAWVLFGEPNYLRAIFATLAVLVMGYPCALGMATPLAMIRGGGIAASKGILMRSGEAFQVFKDVRVIALDKTGTITKGRPSVVAVITVPPNDEITVLQAAATAEQASEHPLSEAIMALAEDKGVLPLETESFKNIPGVGVKATSGSHSYFVSSPRSFDLDAELNEQVHSYEESGSTVVVVTRDDTLLGVIAIADTLKEDAKTIILQIKKEGIKPVLITGDNQRTAEYIASQVGIRRVFAEVLPQQKAEIVRTIQREGTRVAMVGDGINDAPALMQADVGIAFNAGTDIAIEAADIILVHEDLRGVIDAYKIGGDSYRKTKQNVIIAFLFNGIGVPIAMTGLLQPVFAMIAMGASVTAVLLNSYGGKSKKRRSTQSDRSVTYSIPTISCSACIAAMTEALEPLDGVVDVSGDPKQKILTVKFEDGTNLKRVRKEIAKLGHRIEE